MCGWLCCVSVLQLVSACLTNRRQVCGDVKLTGCMDRPARQSPCIIILQMVNLRLGLVLGRTAPAKFLVNILTRCFKLYLLLKRSSEDDRSIWLKCQ